MTEVCQPEFITMQWRCAMPVYEYECAKCKKTFTEFLTIEEMETRKVTCPYCGSSKTKHIVSNIHTITSRKS